VAGMRRFQEFRTDETLGSGNFKWLYASCASFTTRD
jgi:hypothetical protein